MDLNLTPVLNIGAIGDPRVNDGRLLPYLTVDCSRNTQLERLIEVHGETTVPGDVTCAWGRQRFNKRSAFLSLSFERPVNAEAHLEFPISRRGYAVEWIIEVKGLYLQSAKYGRGTGEGFGKPAVLVEVPGSATFPAWKKMYQSSLVRKFRREGVARRDIESKIREFKARNRELWFRQRPGSAKGA